MKDLKSVVSAPTREEAERMCKIAYYLDKKFLRPIDLVDLGIDIYRLKECGEVLMSKKLSEIRDVVIWGRMTDSMKAMFLWSYLCEEIDATREILTQLGTISKSSIRDETSHLDALLLSMSKKLPAELQSKIKEGFGKEWRA